VRCAIDHLTVTAPTLESGAEYVRRALGLAPGPGGRHPRMGTHNLLLRLGDSAFLEVIAPDPDAGRPDRPRWFGLDDPAVLREPRLSAWVARTDTLRDCPAEVLAVVGRVETMSRGAREWLITIPADGSLPMEGAMPMLIEWQSPREPAGSTLPDSGCSLSLLTIQHPDPALVQALHASAGLVDPRLDIGEGEPSLQARVRTPQGVRYIGAKY
jgi:hypothetical protein